MDYLVWIFVDHTTISPWACCLFGLNQQVEMGQSYLSTADQPVGRSANVALQFKGKEYSVAENTFTANSCLGTVRGRSICSETGKNRRRFLLLGQWAEGASPLVLCSQSRKIPASAGPGHMLSGLLPSYCCHSFPLKGHNVEPPLCGKMQSSEYGEEKEDRKCYFSRYCQGQELLRTQA